MKPYILGAIFARGGSKGIPGKNVRLLNGKPLIAYAIETGLAVPLIDQLIVSTDDETIARVARQWGAQVPFTRPLELAADDSAEILSWKHALAAFEQLSGQKVDILVSIPATSPLREPGDVEQCLRKLLETRADAVVTVTDARRSPYFNMVRMDSAGNVRRVIETSQNFVNRQNVPPVFDLTTVAYAARAAYLRRAKSLWEGTVQAVVIPAERALDIDTFLDFEIAEFLIKRKDQ